MLIRFGIEVGSTTNADGRRYFRFAPFVSGCSVNRAVIAALVAVALFMVSIAALNATDIPDFKPTYTMVR